MQTSPEERRGYPTREWTVFDSAFGGARSELVVVTGDTSQGKSTFVRSWLIHYVNQKIPCLMLTLEESFAKVAKRLARYITRLPYDEIKGDALALVGQVFKDWPLYYLDHEGRLDAKFARRAIQYCVAKYGVKFVVIDHLDYLTKNYSAGKSETYVIQESMQDLASLADRHRVCIVALCHPSKTGMRATTKKATGDKCREINMDEMKGSSGIKQEASSVLSLWRLKRGFPEAYVRLSKIREDEFSENEGGKILFSFDRNSRTWIETGEGLERD